MGAPKYNLLFDGSILTNEFSKNDARSGIFFTTKNMFHQLVKRNDINLSLYCELSRYEDLQKYLEKYNLNIDIINKCEYEGLQQFKGNCRKIKADLDKNKHPYKRIFFTLLYAITSGLLKISEPFNLHLKLKQKLNDIDFFFSPCNQTPQFIRKKENIQTSVCLYDTIPLLLPDYYPGAFSGDYWLCDLVKSLGSDEMYFAISESSKQDFLKFSKKITEEQITVSLLATADHFVKINNWEKINETKNKYNIPTDKKYIFSLCTLEPRKNLIRAVKTFIEFIKKNNVDDLIFVLGGGQWERFISELEKEIGNLGDYKSKIIKAGYIDDEDLPTLYSGAEWFVYTSQYEGFGLPPLEAMSCGCPVITSNNSSLPEVVGDAGIMIDWDNNEQHIEAYEKYYYNEDLRKEYAQKGLERAKTFSWEKCVNTIVEKLIERGDK